jgi:hypothetical protein
MCLIIITPKKQSIPRNYIRNGFANNPDGAGFAWADGAGRVTVEKPILSANALHKALREHYGKHVVMVHLRFATHGTISEHNTQPFRIDDAYAFAHNGVLASPPSHLSDYSDSHYFAHTSIAGRTADEIWRDEAWLEWVAGPYNRFSFLRSDGRYKLVGQGWRTLPNGIVVSNGGYLPSDDYRRYSLGYQNRKPLTNAATSSTVQEVQRGVSFAEKKAVDPLDESCGLCFDN